MHKYIGYGLRIHASFEIPELVTGDFEDSDVEIAQTDTLNFPETQLSRNPYQASENSVIWSVPRVARYQITAGQRIHVQTYTGDMQPDTRLHLLSGAFIALLYQRGSVLLHGSVVAAQNRATAFLGRSGAGKTTLAFAMGQRGYQILTDDTLLVKLIDGKPVIVPSFPVIKLRPDVYAHFGLQATTKDPRAYINKRDKHILFTTSHEQEAVPLHHAYVLRRSTAETGPTNRIEPIEGFRKVPALRRQLARPRLWRLISDELASVKQLTTIASHIHLSSIYINDDLETLPPLLDLVSQDMQT